MKRFMLVLLSLSLAVVVFSGHVLYAQFADRAIITGVVTDASGAAVPDAKVTVTNENTSASTVVGTNSAGNYSTPPLTLGKYRVDIEKQGFKLFSHPDIDLQGAVTYRQDAKLELGAVTETVEVSGAATELINTENATVSHTVGETYYKELPAVMGADIRLAESMLQLQPGYVPVQPNGDAIFRGSGFESRINGGQMLATENWFDGAAFGYAEGHQQTQESSLPYTSVQQMTVVENTFSAQYGHTSGGFITYATKSGTSQFHGNLYDFYTNNKMDASNYFVGPLLISHNLNNTLPLGQNNWGFALGGPIPKLKRTFWFFNYDGLDYHSTVNTGLVNILPDALTRQGNFSEYLDTSAPIGKDVLGRNIYKGEIFNPATTRLVGGVPVRDGYGFDAAGNPIPGQANVIPGNDPLWSPLATAIIPDIPQPDANKAVGVPNGFGGNSDDNNKINVRTWLLRFDHNFNDKFSIANTFYENIRPRIAHCGGPGGCNTQNDGETASDKNNTYIGQGFYQRITNHFEHLQMNWVIKNNLFNHTTIAYDRWQMLGHQLSGGAGWNQSLGLGLPDQPIFNNAGFPQLNFNGTYGFTHYGTPWASQGADINNRYQFLDDVTWNTGKHTIKAGVEFRYMTFPQTGWAVNTGGNFNFNDVATAGYDQSGNPLLGGATGNEFASFILGQVDSANFTVPIKYMPKMRYGAPWVNDDIKVTRNLNITLGLRFDWTSGVSEEFNRFSTFDPSAMNPDGHLGATVFNAQQATGKGSWNVGPRFGFAYSLHSKNVIRGGYGMYYAGVQADSWDPYPVDGYETNPFIGEQNGGRFPAFYFSSANSNIANGTGCGVEQSLNTGSPGGVPCMWPTGSITLPPQLNAGVVPVGGSPVGVWPKTYTMPRYQNWSISFQRELSANMAIDIAYVGNHGTRLIDGRSAAGVYDNMNPASVLQTYGTALTTCQFQSGIAQPGCPAGVSSPYPTFTGDLAQALRSWPQYGQINWRSFPFGFSHYNALQMQIQRRMTQGFMFMASYTRSRLMNNGAESGQGAGGPPVQDPANQRDLYTVSADDVPNTFALGWVYKLPFGKGRPLLTGASGAVDKVVGGWQLSGTQTYSSGRPINITMPNSLGPYLFNYARYPNVQGNGRNTNFSDPYTQLYLNPSGWSDPGLSNGVPALGNEVRQDQNVRGFPYYNEDLSLIKDTHFTEQTYLRFHADAGNILNRHYFCYGQAAGNTTVFNTPAFGTVSSQCNIPRRLQLALELFF